MHANETVVTTWVVRKEDRHNKIQHILTDFKKYENEKDLGEGVIPIHQDCNMYVSEADPGVEQAFLLGKKRQAYVVCIEGKLSVSDSVHLDTRDAVEVCTKRHDFRIIIFLPCEHDVEPS